MNIARYRAKLPGLLPAGEGAWRSQPGRPGETEPATRGCKFTRGYKKSLRNFFKSGGFNQKRQLPTLPL